MFFFLSVIVNQIRHGFFYKLKMRLNKVTLELSRFFIIHLTFQKSKG